MGYFTKTINIGNKTVDSNKSKYSLIKYSSDKKLMN